MSTLPNNLNAMFNVLVKDCRYFGFIHESQQIFSTKLLLIFLELGDLDILTKLTHISKILIIWVGLNTDLSNIIHQINSLSIIFLWICNNKNISKIHKIYTMILSYMVNSCIHNFSEDIE